MNSPTLLVGTPETVVGSASNIIGFVLLIAFESGFDGVSHSGGSGNGPAGEKFWCFAMQ